MWIVKLVILPGTNLTGFLTGKACLLVKLHLTCHMGLSKLVYRIHPNKRPQLPM